MSAAAAPLALHADWIAPDWDAPIGVKALVTTRAGGVSGGAYATLNVGFSTADHEASVAANRARLRATLPDEPRWLRQIHGSTVLDAATICNRPEADASYTTEPGAVCAVLVADCLPVLFTARSGGIVAAAHAGWRGLVGGVLDNTIKAMRGRGCEASDVMAYIGPGIGPTAFEVGADVRDSFVAQDAGAAEAFKPERAGKWLADLPALARRALTRCGVHAIFSSGLCTYSDPARFYSYRRDGETGRMAALIWRE